MPTAIQTAIASNDLEAIRRAVPAGAMDAPDADGYTPLYFACMKPGVTLGTIQGLIAAGAAVDARGNDGETPLYIAVFNGRLDVSQLLLAGGADVNGANGPLKETTLHAAARLGHESLLSLLVKRGAELNRKNSRQETPLFAAARAGRHDTACQLLEAGANATIGNEDGKIPLYAASEAGFKHVVLVLKADNGHLRYAKAEADAELRARPMPVPSSLELADRAAADKGFAQEVHRRSSVPHHSPDTTPMEVISIHVPQPHSPDVNVAGGSSKGPCRSLEEVGYDGPPPIPAELQGRPPAQLTRVGGTSMVVGTGTPDGGRAPKRIDEMDGSGSVEFYSPLLNK